MQPFYVPDLLKKLHLLTEHSDLKNVAEIAARLDIKENTLRSWTKDHGVRPEGTVSKHGREPVIDLFFAYLPRLKRAQIITLLEGPFADLADAFQARNTISLAALVDSEANFKHGKLITSKSKITTGLKRIFKRVKNLGSGAVENAQGSEDVFEFVTVNANGGFYVQQKIKLGQDFRIEFNAAHRGKYLLGLQQSSQGWGVIAANLNDTGQIIHLPAPDKTEQPPMSMYEEPTTMCEHHNFGPSRFTAIQSTEPFPEFIHTNLKDNIPLSRTDITFLTHHLQNLPKPNRSLFALDVAVI